MLNSGVKLSATQLQNINREADLGNIGASSTNQTGPQPSSTAVATVQGSGAQNTLVPYGSQVLPQGWTKSGATGALMIPVKKIRPKWHAPWKIYKVLSGHHGWVRCVDVDVSNDFFVTGSADRTIKIWDMASCDLKLTLTGHTDHVRGLKISERHPYLFSVGLDQTVKCWDLEQNKVIRSYHGHLSGVFTVDMHPTLNILFSGGRDAVCRVWDIRTKAQIFCLE
eukprot:UN25025